MSELTKEYFDQKLGQLDGAVADVAKSVDDLVIITKQGFDRVENRLDAV